MKKMILFSILIFLTFSIPYVGCSNNDKTGSNQKVTEKAADKIVETIEAPIDLAKSVKDQEEERLKNLDKSVREE